MEKFNHPEFIDKKYQDLAGSKQVERAVLKSRKNGKTPHEREDRLDVYMDRLEYITEDDRGFELLKYKILDKHVTKPEDISDKYWENQEEEERKMGKGADWDKAKSDTQTLEKFKREHLKTVLDDQRSSLEQWVDYFGSSDSSYIPRELKYWIFRSILGMQELVKKKDGEREYIDFPKRSKGTVKPFPDINYEALAYVVDAIKTKYEGKDIEFEHDIQSVEREEFKAFLQKEDFSKLYGWANELMSTIPKHLLPITKGKWVKYNQGSDPTELIRTIRGRGTGWCTAGKNTATTQLKAGDFHVYYTLDDEGKPKIPRIAIRMEGNNKIAELPRGIAYKQNIDPYMTDILEEKLDEFGVIGEQYKKRVNDMEKLTDIQNKIISKQTLNKTELEFLYEINSPIEGFGYRKDPRIEEIRSQRNIKEDIPIIFECEQNQIATNTQEVNENTKVYIGSWNINVWQKIKNFPNITHLYESFPDKKIFTYELKTDSSIQSSEQAKEKLESQGIWKNEYTEVLLDKTEYSKESKTYKLVQFTVEQLGFPQGATTDQIYAKARELGLKLCPAEVGPQLRLSYPGKDWKLIAMKQISDRRGSSPRVFYLCSVDSGLKLNARYAGPSDGWSSDSPFVFLAS